ncbi:MAG: hypothetical protein H0Z35_11000 [Thermoanaerobacteraceae bacterium]|nr:hypothetical protein [Thermoanaerobacteraceae bacterium]
MTRHKIIYANKSEAEAALEQLCSRLPEQGTIDVEIKDHSSRNNLTDLWEEMGSSTGTLIGRFIGAGSEITALGLQGLLFSAAQLMGTVQGDASNSGQEYAAVEEPPPDPK